MTDCSPTRTVGVSPPRSPREIVGSSDLPSHQDDGFQVARRKKHRPPAVPPSPSPRGRSRATSPPPDRVPPVAEGSVARAGRIPLTADELTARRAQRKLKRQRLKEVKRVEKDERKRLDIYRPRNTKLGFITANVLAQASSVSSPRDVRATPAQRAQFRSEEYPDLSQPAAKSVRGPKVRAPAAQARSAWSTVESGSEWETVAETTDGEADVPSATPRGGTVVTTPLSPGPIGYSSMLQKPVVATQSARPVSRRPVSRRPPTKPAGESVPVVSTKVKKNDPITFDLWQAIQATKIPKAKGGHAVLGSKILPAPAPRNALDSTAPSQRRGKERVTPKKRKLTKMRKIILADRERRRDERISNTGSVIPSIAVESSAIAVESSTIAIESSTIAIESSTIVIESSTFPGLAKDVNPIPSLPHVNLEASGSLEASHKPDVNHCHPTVADEPVEESHEPDEMKVGETQRLWDEKRMSGIHSRKFREYCNHTPCPHVDEHVKTLMSNLVRFQDRQFAQDPIKAKYRRRYVVGLREVKKFLQVKKITLMLIAPDVEAVKNEGGLNDMITDLIHLAEAHAIPVAFTLSRWKLGKACARKVPVSAIGILNYQGSEENAKEIIRMIGDLRDSYQTRLEDALAGIRSATAGLESEVETAPLDETQKIRMEFMEKIKKLAMS